MIVARWGMLAVAAALMLAAFGAGAIEHQASALRVLVAAVVALLAPLFWPGNAATPARTALRIAVWSAAATGLAAIVMRLLASPAQPVSPIAISCAVLMPMLLLTHAAVAGLESRLHGASTDAAAARETAGRTVAIALALLGSLPLWLGPVGELLSARHTWVIDAMLGASPLTHLAVASENDLLRNQWLYQHSNLAALQFSYPGLAEVIGSYVSACLLLGIIALAYRRRIRPVGTASHTHSTTEKAP